jgi:branched-chain amino acid aminotransferase
LPTQAKVGATYTAFRLSRLEASMRGLDEAILLNERGQIAETAGGSIFIVRAGILATPSLDSGILPSITRRMVIELLCPYLGYEVREIPITTADLHAADEAMITGTLDEISIIDSVEGHQITNRGGSDRRCVKIADTFHSLCKGSKFHGTEWVSLLPVQG